MKKYRIKETNGKFIPQERFFFFFWNDVKLYDIVVRDWFVRKIAHYYDDDSVDSIVCEDGWGTIKYIIPTFKTLERAEFFIWEYKKFLERKAQRYREKYYY